MTKGQDWLQSKFLPPAGGVATDSEDASIILPVNYLEEALRFSYPHETSISTPDLLRFYATVIDKRPDESRIGDPHFDDLSSAFVSLADKIEKAGTNIIEIGITHREWDALQKAPACCLSISTQYEEGHSKRDKVEFQGIRESIISPANRSEADRDSMASLFQDRESLAHMMEELFDEMFRVIEKTKEINKKPSAFGYDSGPNGF